MSSALNFQPFVGPTPDGDCTICMEPLIGQLTGHGAHVFHIDCIARWARNNPTCPLCQAAVDTNSIFAQQSFYTRTQQILQSIDCQEIYHQAAPYLFTAIPYALRYGVSTYCIGSAISSGESICQGIPTLICSSVPMIKTAFVAVGVGIVIYDHWEGHLLGHNVRRRHGIPEIFG